MSIRTILTRLNCFRRKTCWSTKNVCSSWLKDIYNPILVTAQQKVRANNELPFFRSFKIDTLSPSFVGCPTLSADAPFISVFNMGFENSSQSRYFLFEDQQALIACKHDAAVVRSLSIERNLSGGKRLRKVKPRSFACGYQQKWRDASICQSSSPQHFQTIGSLFGSPARMTSTDQEMIIHFHAHHIHRLVGPSAIYPELRRTTSTLSTAVMLFRRFYLSNSVIDFPAHAIGAASALLAVKVDCEPSLPVSFPLHLMDFCLDSVEDRTQKNPMAVFQSHCHRPFYVFGTWNVWVGTKFCDTIPFFLRGCIFGNNKSDGSPAVHPMSNWSFVHVRLFHSHFAFCISITLSRSGFSLMRRASSAKERVTGSLSYTRSYGLSV